MTLFVIIVAAVIVGNYIWDRMKKSRLSSVTPAGQSKPGVTPEQVESDRANGYGFLVGNNCEISLDTDINNRKAENRFCIHGHSDDQQASTTSEYEYRLEGTDVLVRKLETYNEVMGAPRLWKIRDGVVLETELRNRGFDDGDIAAFKEDTQWSHLPTAKWDGFKYFVISKNVSTVDARRFFRQELERFRAGVAALQKLDVVKPDADALKKCGLTWEEYNSKEDREEQLTKLLVDASASS